MAEYVDDPNGKVQYRYVQVDTNNVAGKRKPDRTGSHQTKFAYDGNGNLQTATNPLNQSSADGSVLARGHQQGNQLTTFIETQPLGAR